MVPLWSSKMWVHDGNQSYSRADSRWGSITLTPIMLTLPQRQPLPTKVVEEEEQLEVVVP